MSMIETPSRLESLEHEQQRLRRQVRWVLGLALAGPLLVLGADLALSRASGGTPGELRVSRLVLVDGAGRARVELELASDSQEPRLVFTHPDGKPWATLEVAALPGAPKERRQATFTLHDETGVARIGMGASSQDSGVALYQSQGTPGLALYHSQESRGLVVLNSRVPRIHLRYNQHDDSELSELLFWDEQKRVQVDVTAGRGGTSMSLQNPDGQRVFSAP
ncbi:hypothetical protein [Cystobacter fuscus]|uniref:hypothetical protein n=1 Tax=Cystobacter fuscus TaxID=43 RepID=UPI002B308E10|nr:hypothetical protein F0U63_19580 [Cystobacter fuscus]